MSSDLSPLIGEHAKVFLGTNHFSIVRAKHYSVLELDIQIGMDSGTVLSFVCGEGQEFRGEFAWAPTR